MVNDTKIISYGQSSYGYDVSLGREFKVFTDVRNAVIDPKNFSDDAFMDILAKEDETGAYIMIPANSFALGVSREYFRIPRDIMVLCVGKSTYARCGIIANITPLEPEWEGHITLEISNTAPCPAKVYAEEGLCQLLFIQADHQCATSYADKDGKYQKQIGIVTARG